MKVTDKILNMALGLLILVSPGLTQELSPKQQRKHAMYEFKMKHNQQWEIHWNKNTGTVASILGHTTAPFSGSPAAIAKQFLRAEKQMLGIKSVDRDLKSGKTTFSKKGGTRVRFSQTYKGIPVLNSGYLIAIDEQNRIYFISGDYYPELDVDVTRYLSPGNITSIVQSDLAGATITYTGKVELFILPEVDDTSEKYTLVYQLDVSAKEPTGDWRYLVDAVNGEILVKKNLISHVNGNGDVYTTNPNHGGVVNRTIQRLRDISPRRLDGDNVIVFNSEGDEAESGSATFVYSPSNTHFDEVMAYYHSDEFEDWLINSVDMGTNRVPRVTIRTHHDDGLAHYHSGGPDMNEIHFSDGATGFNNPTKEAAVIAHEYMHRVSETYNSLAQPGSQEPPAMDEAYSDYFAVAYTNQFFSDSEIMEYVDQPGGRTPKRDLDNTHTYSEIDDIDLDGLPGSGPHDKSVILSGALWDLRNDISSSTADKSILASLDLLDNSPSYEDARNALKAAAASQYSDEIDDAFAKHRIPLLTAPINGPGAVEPGVQYAWSADIDGELGSVSYQWSVKYEGSGSWTNLGTGSSQSHTFYQNYTLNELKVVVNSNGQSTQDIQGVWVTDDGGFGKRNANITQEKDSNIPDNFALHQNYPNPFNPATEIKFELPENGYVIVSIFNVMGQKIRTLVDNQRAAGYHSVIWDSKDEFGKEAASGIYIYRISVKPNKVGVQPFESVRKMTLLR